MQFFVLERVTIEATSTTGYSFYLGQPLKITCFAIPTGEFHQAVISLGSFHYVCAKIKSGWNSVGLDLDEEFDSIKDQLPPKADCNLLDEENTMTVSFNITREISKRNITCARYYHNLADSQIAATSLRKSPLYGKISAHERFISFIIFLKQIQ